jgi:DNA-binding CsgD family transcriptional regulator
MEQFRRVALHARQAVRTQAYLGQQAADVVAGALESIALTCFVCAADGRVLAMTRAAERLLIAGDRLQLRAGRLLPTGKGSALAAALIAATDRTFAPSRPIVLRDSAGLHPLALEVARLPFARWPASFDEAVLVMVRDPIPRSTANPARIAASLFNFTPGETSVAALLLSGQSVQEAAASLGIGPGTVRTHVRRLYEKTGATNQLKFAAMLSALA